MHLEPVLVLDTISDYVIVFTLPRDGTRELARLGAHEVRLTIWTLMP